MTILPAIKIVRYNRVLFVVTGVCVLNRPKKCHILFEWPLGVDFTKLFCTAFGKKFQKILCGKNLRKNVDEIDPRCNLPFSK